MYKHHFINFVWSKQSSELILISFFMALSKEYIIALQSIKGFGIATINKIQKASIGNNVYSIRDLHALLGDILNIKVLPTVGDLLKARDIAYDILEKSEHMGINVISSYDAEFPQQLLSTVSETGKLSIPNLLYYKGNLNITHSPALAIIGTREPTVEGVFAARHFADAFAAIGVNIISGLALGCDTAAHQGALDSNGLTTAFLAHGLDSVYPKENIKLANEIVDRGGLLLSEYPIGEAVNKYNLVARDRLQAGLSNGTLLVQTSLKGGSMHAVNATLMANKPLWVVEYSKDLGEKISGNRYLREGKNGRVIGLPYVSKEEIIEKKQQYLELLKFEPQNIDKRFVEDQLSLF